VVKYYYLRRPVDFSGQTGIYVDMYKVDADTFGVLASSLEAQLSVSWEDL
jgi:hypothetical protein